MCIYVYIGGFILRTDSVVHCALLAFIAGAPQVLC